MTSPHPSYAEAVAALHARGAELAVRRKFDLGHMRTLANALGNPQQQFPSVLIAGTNGKGSTAATLAAIARAAGLRTGLYTSPHLSRVNERICLWNVSGDDMGPAGDIADARFAAAFGRVDSVSAELVRSGALPHEPSFFETLTAMAFCTFAEAKVELAVLEVGMGGRLDATNIVDPLLSVITDIDLDHTEWLGATLALIAREKAGILRDGGTLITLPQHPEVNQAMGEEAMRRGVNGINAAQYLPGRNAAAGLRSVYDLQVGSALLHVDSPLGGQHQQRNVALAIAAALALRGQYNYQISLQDIERGISATNWPGRLELFPERGDRCAVLLDVAHNAAGVWTLRAAVSAMEDSAAAGKTLLFGCLADKPLAQLAQILFPQFAGPRDRVVLTRPTSPRAADPAELAAIARTLGVLAEVVEPPAEALRRAVDTTPQDGLLIAAGSVYLVGELRPLLMA